MLIYNITPTQFSIIYGEKKKLRQQDYSGTRGKYPPETNLPVQSKCVCLFIHGTMHSQSRQTYPCKL